MAKIAALALEKAFDAGQAAKRYGYAEADCPFEEGAERDSWLDGFDADLEDKWLQPGRAHTVAIDE